MKLVTFQSMEALKDLVNKGYLECDESKINLEKVGATYSWVLEKMNDRFKNPTHIKYPLWCWVRCYNNICPPKHKGEPVEGFDVKITFHKPKEEVFITDFRRYSFLLNNNYIPSNLKDKKIFDKKLKECNITLEELRAFVRKDKYDKHRTDKEYLEICEEIRNSFERCITEDSDVLQGCVWRIDVNEIENIEMLNDKNYRYGSLNYVRKNGKRINWQEEFYKRLKLEK